MIFLQFLLILASQLCIVISSTEGPKAAATAQSVPSSITCTNPNNETGICVNILRCPSSLNLIRTRGNDSTIRSFLRQSACGYEGIRVKVCCITTSYAFTTNIADPSVAEVIKNANYSQCGKSDRKNIRIVGGINSSLGDWPWMVALGYLTSLDGKLYVQCGGTLVSNQWIVTAAHCVTNRTDHFIMTTARIGDLNLNDNGQDNALAIDVPIDEIIPHPDYSSKTRINDIALIRLRNAVNFTKSIRPVCMLSEQKYKEDQFYLRKKPHMVKWKTSERLGISTNNKLEENFVDIEHNEQCDGEYQNPNSSQPPDQQKLCVSSNEDEICQDDSGWPLFIPVLDKYFLAGVASYGTKCTSSPTAIFTKVAYFSDWIRLIAGL